MTYAHKTQKNLNPSNLWNFEYTSLKVFSMKAVEEAIMPEVKYLLNTTFEIC